MTPDQAQSLLTIADAAVAAERATGCPAELSAAQCIIESAWLTRSPGNNCFGIKATDDNCTYCLTKEFIDGTWTSPTLAFEAYPTLADCFSAHARLLQGGVYAAVWSRYKADHDLDSYIQGIAVHYATAPDYAAQIIQLAHGPHVTADVVAARGKGV